MAAISAAEIGEIQRAIFHGRAVVDSRNAVKQLLVLVNAVFVFGEFWNDNFLDVWDWPDIEIRGIDKKDRVESVEHAPSTFHRNNRIIKISWLWVVCDGLDICIGSLDGGIKRRDEIFRTNKVPWRNSSVRPGPWFQ